MEINKVYNSSISDFTTDVEFDAIVTDPPYGINYRGNQWDSYNECVSFQPETWSNLSEFLKPGGYAVIFGATRTFHRLVLILLIVYLNFKI